MGKDSDKNRIIQICVTHFCIIDMKYASRNCSCFPNGFGYRSFSYRQECDVKRCVKDGSAFGVFLPDGLDSVAEVVEDMPALDAAPCGQKAADDAGDVTADVECLRVVDTYAFHAQAETAYAGQDHGLALAEPLFENVLQFCHYADH